MIDMPASSPPVTPVTTACVVSASRFYQVPLPILAGVMALEGGSIGKIKSNKNGTYDYGPMQINTVWLSGLKKQGITSSSVANNGCLNVYVGAAILQKHANETNGNWWDAVGNYHSKTQKHHDKYLVKVVKKVQKLIAGTLTLASILERANNS